jgi:hypothetical protein
MDGLQRGLGDGPGLPIHREPTGTPVFEEY